MKVWPWVVFGVLLPAIGCRPQFPGPEPLDLNQEMCGFCRMAISQKRFAAEFFDFQGNCFKFDDIGCLIHYVRMVKGREGAKAFYVNDYQSREWLEARKARFVYAASLNTPMSSHLAAFESGEEAREWARQHEGQVLTFEELWTRWGR